MRPWLSAGMTKTMTSFTVEITELTVRSFWRTVEFCNGSTSVLNAAEFATFDG